MTQFKILFSSITVLSLLGIATDALAQTPPPSSPTWHWPLYEPVRAAGGGFEKQPSGALQTSTPRPNVWGSHLAYENYGDGIDPHPGIDIRGDADDIVELPLDGEIVYLQNGSHCEGSNDNKCRLFVRNGDLMYYVGHFEFRQVPDGPLIRELRDKIAAASFSSPGGNSGPPNAPILVSKGQQIGQIEEYWIDRASGSPFNWAHLHISVFDRARNYDDLNPLHFLSTYAQGSNGLGLAIVDDERPFVGPVRVELDGTANGSAYITDTNTSPLPGESSLRSCGLHASGRLDVLAHMTDTFFTSRPAPNPFNRESDWNETIGIYGARFIAKHLASNHEVSGQWYRSPVACSGYDCGAWRVPFAAAPHHPIAGGGFEYGARPTSGNDANFFAYMRDTAPYFIGWDFSFGLFKESESSLDHSPPDNAFQYVHYLTNGVTEASTNTVNGYWDTEAGPEGVYALTVEAWDQAGNIGYNTTNVTVNRGGLDNGASAWGPVIAKDHPTDLGQVPSTPNGEVFWQSPDILVLPQGDPLPSNPTTAVTTGLVAGETYNVYVRAHNTGCKPTSGVQARVWSANPATGFSDASPVGSITPAVTISGGGHAYLGPIPWTITAADLDNLNEGHRCLLAKVGTPDDPITGTEDPTSFNPALDERIIQRNVQTSNLYFAIKNPKANALPSDLIIDASDIPDGARFQLLIQNTPELGASWNTLCPALSATAGAVCWVYQNWYVLEVTAGIGTSPIWTMPGVSQLDAIALYELPTGTTGTVVVTHRLSGTPVGGMTFYVEGAPAPVIVR